MLGAAKPSLSGHAASENSVEGFPQRSLWSTQMNFTLALPLPRLCVSVMGSIP